MTHGSAYTIQPLGDAALLVDFGNKVDEKINDHIIHLCNLLQLHPINGMVEAVPAYSSLAVFYDLNVVLKKWGKEKTAFNTMKENLEGLISQQSMTERIAQRHFTIPVCYDIKYGPDLHDASESLYISIEEIIRLHTSRTYRVYMMGFLPGFPYLGMVDEKIILPRKSFPVRVRAGSVGLAGQQTGIYPLDSTGGWHIIGRTPIRLFEKEKEDPVLLQSGDQITFYAIRADEFENY